jgi:hypothetical protein
MSKAPIQVVTIKYSSFDNTLHISPCIALQGLNKYSVALRSLFLKGLTSLLTTTGDLGVNVSFGITKCNKILTAQAPPTGAFIDDSTYVDTIPLNSLTLPDPFTLVYQNSDCYNSRVLYTPANINDIILTTVVDFDNIPLHGDKLQATFVFYEEPGSFEDFKSPP